MEPLSELDHFWYYSLEAMEKTYSWVDASKASLTEPRYSIVMVCF